MSTKDILKQLAKFGFYIRYDVKSNLPDETFVFLQQMLQLGYDKITKVLLQTSSRDGDEIWIPSIVVFKSTKDNIDLWGYDIKLPRSKYMKKIDHNSILNVTDQGIKWDWVTSYFNISDILNENLDSPSFEVNNKAIDLAANDLTEADTNPVGFTPAGYISYDNTNSQDAVPYSNVDEEFTPYEDTEEYEDDESE